MNSIDRLAYNTKKTSEAILLAYSPSFPLEIKEGTSFYIPDYYKVCDNLERGIQKISQKSSIEKRIAKGLRCLELDSLWNDWNDLMSLLYSQYSNRNVVDSVENRGEPTFKFKEGVREIKIQEFEDYWNNPEKAQWGQIWGLMQNFALEELRKRRPCPDCPQYSKFTKF